MGTRKIKNVYKKDKLVTSINDIINNKHEYFIIYNDKHISYFQLAVMSLSSLLRLIDNKVIYRATILVEQYTPKTKTKVIPKIKSNITGCKATIDSIYNDIKDNC